MGPISPYACLIGRARLLDILYSSTEPISVVVFSTAGGAAHGFEVGGYSFDAGPSFFLWVLKHPDCYNNCFGIHGANSEINRYEAFVRTSPHILDTCGLIVRSGLTGPKGTGSNPLKQVLDAVGEQVECKSYDRVRG